MQRKNIKEVRKELKIWGKFWRAKQVNQGQATLITEKVCEIMRKGAFVTGTPAGAFGASDSIRVPERIEEVGKAVDRLGQNCRIAIVKKYIKGDRQVSGYYIDEGERALSGML